MNSNISACAAKGEALFTRELLLKELPRVKACTVWARGRTHNSACFHSWDDPRNVQTYWHEAKQGWDTERDWHVLMQNENWDQCGVREDCVPNHRGWSIFILSLTFPTWCATWSFWGHCACGADPVCCRDDHYKHFTLKYFNNVWLNWILRVASFTTCSFYA